MPSQGPYEKQPVIVWMGRQQIVPPPPLLFKTNFLKNGGGYSTNFTWFGAHLTIISFTSISSSTVNFRGRDIQKHRSKLLSSASKT